MDANLALLKQIHKNAAMGVGSLPHVLALPQCRAMVPALQTQLRSYRTIAAQSQSYARQMGAVLPKPDSTALALSAAHLRFQSWMDPSTSRLAETMIQARTVGSVEMTRLLHQVTGRADPTLLALGQSLLSTEEESIQQMKRFL